MEVSESWELSFFFERAIGTLEKKSFLESKMRSERLHIAKKGFSSMKVSSSEEGLREGSLTYGVE